MMKLIINSLYKNKEVSRSETKFCISMFSQGKKHVQKI